MAITFRNYSPEPFFTEDYRKVRDFLIRINTHRLCSPRFLWGAWEWAVTHGGRDQDNPGKIGLWEDDGELVALATYECQLGEAFLIADEDYSDLKPEMVAYARENLHSDGKLLIALPDDDRELQRAAAAQRFRPTQRNERVALLDIAKLQKYTLPAGFTYVSLADGWNWRQYNRVMWRGFDHEGRPPFDDETLSGRMQMLSSPMVIQELVVAVKAPDGNFVSHCGMWFRPDDFYCMAEPVVTDPEYRMMGLGKAAVLEAVRRCGALGAKQAVVGSGRQFYYNIGFYPAYTVTYWEATGGGFICDRQMI